jgi:hypothetical protein
MATHVTPTAASSTVGEDPIRHCASLLAQVSASLEAVVAAFERQKESIGAATAPLQKASLAERRACFEEYQRLQAGIVDHLRQAQGAVNGLYGLTLAVSDRIVGPTFQLRDVPREMLPTVWWLQREWRAVAGCEDIPEILQMRFQQSGMSAETPERLVAKFHSDSKEAPRWPATAVRDQADALSSQQYWYQGTLLEFLGYRVSRFTARTVEERRQILYYAVWGKLPLVRSGLYMSRWGMPGTDLRLHRLTRALVYRLKRAQGIDPDRWNLLNDLSYLRRMFYETAVPAFEWAWPLTVEGKLRKDALPIPAPVRPTMRESCQTQPSCTPSSQVLERQQTVSAPCAHSHKCSRFTAAQRVCRNVLRSITGSSILRKMLHRFSTPRKR